MAIIVAAVLPLSALLLASRWATNEVTARTIAGARSTATAVVGQADQSYEDALTVVKAASARPSLLRALTGHDRASAVAGLANLRASGPFFAVQLLDRSGRVVASAPAGTTPSAPPRGTSAATLAQGPLRREGSKSLRSVTASIRQSGRCSASSRPTSI